MGESENEAREGPMTAARAAPHCLILSCSNSLLLPAHQPASSGKRLAHFTLVRGSAIMAPTASRQAW